MVVPNVDEVQKNIHIKSDRDFCMKKYPEFTIEMENRYPNLPHIERLYRMLFPGEYKCVVCGKPCSFISFNKGYRSYCCAGCASKDDKIKQLKKVSTLSHYGVENPSQSQNVLTKKQNTMLNKYGVTNTSKLSTNREQAKQTSKERYGVDNYAKTIECKEHISSTIKERYGVDWFTQTNAYKQKSKQTFLDNWGENREGIVKKVQYTKEQKYGDPNYNNRDKAKETLLKLYGSEGYRSQIPHKDTDIENIIKSMLDKHNISYECNNRTLLEGREIDILIKSHNIAIECNGVYWHSSEFKANNYHYKKWCECKNKGYTLLTFWEDQSINTPDIIESIILSKLGCYDIRLYARNCKVCCVDNVTATKFLYKYHIQGAVNSNVKLGLFYNDELISLMTFGKKRGITKSRDVWELYRYCTKSGYQVIGGASKLFAHFINEYHPKEIESYSSNDISNGELYKTLNFVESKHSISYWYIKNFKRYHRYNFTKFQLVKQGFDPNKSEFEIMKERNFQRIYDCGQTLWVWKNPTYETIP